VTAQGAALIPNTSHTAPGISAAPGISVPKGACDCHVHVFGPFGRFPLAAERAYTPGEATLSDLRAHQAALGLDRVVLVQPSVYGSDNACLVDALERLEGQARGVAVLDADVNKATCGRLHEAGVRALRVNLGTHGISAPDVAQRQLMDAFRTAEWFGWHIQIYAGLPVLAALQPSLRQLELPLVIDHFAMAPAAGGPEQQHFDAILALVAEGRAYVKLSAPHRISSLPGNDDVTPLARALIAANPDRMLWASDWPHFTTADGFRREDDGAALDRLGAWARDPCTFRRILVDNPAHLYDFQEQ
jgi:predicted TIM-barrel fold metal-dependent hydrolase